jgi:hypothetical protein
MSLEGLPINRQQIFEHHSMEDGSGALEKHDLPLNPENEPIQDEISPALKTLMHKDGAESTEKIGEIRRILQVEEPVNDTTARDISSDIRVPRNVPEINYHPEEPFNTSRRRFVKNATFAGLGSFLKRLGFGEKGEEKDPNITEKTAERSEYFDKGILDLQKKALSENTETEMMYVKDVDGMEQWVNSSVNQGETWIMLNPDVLEDALKRKPKELSLNHTHPTDLIQKHLVHTGLSKIDAKVLQNPPSTLDFMYAHTISKAVKDKSKKTKVTFGAVDHSGVWNFEIFDDSYMSRIAKYQDRVSKLGIEVMENEPKLKEKIAEETGGITDPRIAGSVILNILGNPNNVEDGTVSKKTVRKFEDIQREALKFETYNEAYAIELQEILPTLDEHERGNVDDMQKRIIAKQRDAIFRYTKLCQKMGIKVTFTPISKFRQ